MRTLSVLLSAVFSVPVCAQDAGLRGGTHEAPQVPRLGPPDPASAERVITIEATAEVRVLPSRLRVVFSASALGATVSAASTAGRELVTATKAQLIKTGIAEADLDTDFIAALPVFGWNVEKQNGKDALIEKRTGFRVQYNLHAAVADETGARNAIEAATTGFGVDVVAVDYWSDQLEAKQQEARQKALAAAQQKAKLLLSAFAEPPKLVNVHEQTRVLFPQQLYQTLPRVEDSAGQWYSEDRMPRVPAPRPLQTYYRGLFADVDAVEKVMPGKREIEVVATVRLYYAAPDRPQLLPPPAK
jgi:uncharacterized protein YggE